MSEQIASNMQKDFQNTLDGLEKKRNALQAELASTLTAIDQYKGAVQSMDLLRKRLASEAPAAPAPSAPAAPSAPQLKVVPPAPAAESTPAPTQAPAPAAPASEPTTGGTNA